MDKVVLLLWSQEDLELTACLLLLHVLVAKLPPGQAEPRLTAMLGSGAMLRIFTILHQVCGAVMLASSRQCGAENQTVHGCPNEWLHPCCTS